MSPVLTRAGHEHADAVRYIATCVASVGDAAWHRAGDEHVGGAVHVSGADGAESADVVGGAGGVAGRVPGAAVLLTKRAWPRTWTPAQEVMHVLLAYDFGRRAANGTMLAACRWNLAGGCSAPTRITTRGD